MISCNVRAIRTLVFLFLLTVFGTQCGNRDTMAPSEFEGVIRIEIVGSEGHRGEEATGTPGISRRPSATDHRETVECTKSSGDPPLINRQGIDRVTVRVFEAGLTLIVSQDLSYNPGDSSYEGYVSVSYGLNRIVTLEARESNDDLVYFGIDTDVDVVEGDTAVAQITPIDFATSFGSVPYIQSESVGLTWNSVDSASSYRVEQDTMFIFQTATIVYSGPDTACTFTPGENNVSYYRVRPLREGLGVAGRLSAVDSVLFFVEDTIILAIGDGSGSPGSMDNLVSVSVTNPDSIAGIQFDLYYDGSVLTATDAMWTSRIENAWWGYGTLSWNVIEPGHARYILYSTEVINFLLPGFGPVIYLVFDVDSSATSGTTVQLDISNDLVSDAFGNEMYFEAYNGTFVVE